MKRILVIIANDGGVANYLPGVDIDVDNYVDFFKAPYGGAWLDSEIHIFRNTTFAIVNSFFQAYKRFENVNYWLIIFCGHGYAKGTADANETVFELSDGNEISLTQLEVLTRGSARMIIADSCRKLYPVQIVHRLCESTFSNTFPKLNPQICRNIYNNALQSLSYRIHYALSTSIDETAGDDDNIGGLFSHCLIKTAKDYVKHMARNGIDFMGYYEVHQDAAADTTLLKSDQHPVCSMNTDEVPFVVFG